MNPDILIKDTQILPDPGMPGMIDTGFIAITGDRITQLGPMKECVDIQAETTVDGHGCLAMPGLINSHCHGAMTLFRGLADDLELGQWLNEHIFPAEAENVNPEMVYWCSKLAAAEMILSGTTTVADGYFHEHDAARAFADAGLRAVAAQGVIDFPAPGVPDPAGNIDAAGTFVEEWKGRHPLITPAVFVHSPYTCSAATIRKAKELTRLENVPLFIHVAETRQEQAMIQEPSGGSPVRHLDDLGVLDQQTICIHCVWVDEKDREILAGRNAGVVVCPQSHLKLASGFAPLAGMLKKSITVGLGTDGCASNNGLDMFREMDVCAKVQKIHTMDPVAVPAKDILTMATRNGAALLGLAGQAGTLAAGNKADLILINIDRPHLQPFYGPDLLVYAAGGADVQTVIINGRLVMDNRSILTMDLGETMDRVRRLAFQIIC